MTEPAIIVPWRHDRFRVIRVHLVDLISEPDVSALAREIVAAAQRSPDLPTLTVALKAIANSHGWRFGIYSEQDRMDFLGEWVTVGYGPLNSN